MTVLRPFGVSGVIISLLSALIFSLLVFHRHIPNAAWNLGSLTETFLPWLGWFIPPLLVWAGIKRNLTVIAVSLLPVLVWGYIFGPLLPPKSEGPGEFRVVSHNVEDVNPDPESTARDLMDSNADLIALVEVTEDAKPIYEEVLGEEYPHVVDYGTVALWSQHPIRDSYPVEIGLDWVRAFQTHVDIDGQDVSVYVAHLLSVRFLPDAGFTIDQRNETVQRLGDDIEAQELDQVVLMGDLNGTAQDKTLAPITFQMQSAHANAGQGFGFTWPSSFPVARIDHVLYRGLDATDAQVLEPTESDHRPVQADFNF